MLYNFLKNKLWQNYQGNEIDCFVDMFKSHFYEDGRNNLKSNKKNHEQL